MCRCYSAAEALCPLAAAKDLAAEAAGNSWEYYAPAEWMRNFAIVFLLPAALPAAEGVVRFPRAFVPNLRTGLAGRRDCERSAAVHRRVQRHRWQSGAAARMQLPPA